MDLREIARLRLRNQRVAGNRLKSAEEVVGWLGAVQSQEYPVAKWSLGQRTTDATGLTDTAVDALLSEGKILRTHILRPTWHFVLPADIRWMMALTAPRIAAKIRPGATQPVPAEPVIQRGLDAIREALTGGRRMTRTQIARLLTERGVVTSAQEMVPIFIRAELDLVTVSGGLEGKIQTYALLDERVPAGADFDRDRALAELTRRFFTSHGPATIQDFTWWSSLTVADTRRGLEINAAEGGALERVEVDGATYWWTGDTSGSRALDDPSPTIHLMQGYDEYIVGYRPPRHPINVSGLAPPGAMGWPPLVHAVFLDSQLIGWWRRVATKSGYSIESKLLRALSAAESGAMEAAAERYNRFVGLPVALT